MFAKLPLLTSKQKMKFIPSSQIISRNYLRVTALDVPGVLAHITGILSKNGISLAAITQHEARAGQAVPIVITTHEARDGHIGKALKEIDRLKSITAPTIRIRVLA